MDKNKPSIAVVTTAYEGADFPEAARYPEWLRAQLVELFPGVEVDVYEGPTEVVSARFLSSNQDDHTDSNTSHEIRARLPEFWETFCAHGYRELAAEAE